MLTFALAMNAPPQVTTALARLLRHVQQAESTASTYDAERATLADHANLRALEAEVSGTVSSLHATMVAALRLKGSDRARRAQEVLAATFPDGLRAHVHATDEEKAALTERLVALLQGPHADTAAMLGLTEVVADLKSKVERFSRAVAPPASSVAYDDVELAIRKAREAALFAVVVAVAAYDPDEASPARDRIVGPWFHLQTEVHAANRRRQHVAKVRKAAKAEKEAAKAAAEAKPAPAAEKAAKKPETAAARTATSIAPTAKAEPTTTAKPAPEQPTPAAESAPPAPKPAAPAPADPAPDAPVTTTDAPTEDAAAAK
jgi:hypothetical protein